MRACVRACMRARGMRGRDVSVQLASVRMNPGTRVRVRAHTHTHTRTCVLALLRQMLLLLLLLYLLLLLLLSLSLGPYASMERGERGMQGAVRLVERLRLRRVLRSQQEHTGGGVLA